MPNRLNAHMPHLSFLVTVLAVAALLAALAAGIGALDQKGARATHLLAVEPAAPLQATQPAAAVKTPAEDPSVPPASEVFKTHKGPIFEEMPVAF